MLNMKVAVAKFVPKRNSNLFSSCKVHCARENGAHLFTCSLPEARHIGGRNFAAGCDSCHASFIIQVKVSFM